MNESRPTELIFSRPY